MKRRSFLQLSILTPIALVSIDVLASTNQVNNFEYATHSDMISGIYWVNPVKTLDELNAIPIQIILYDKHITLGCWVESEQAAFIRSVNKRTYLFRTLIDHKWILFSGIKI